VKSRGLVLVALALVIVLAACTSSTAPTTTTTTSTTKATGVVTGVAYACSGLPPVITGRQKVKVSLYSGSRPVASETIRSAARYRFSVTPGAYQVKGWWGSRAVIVRTGHVATVNIVDYCK